MSSYKRRGGRRRGRRRRRGRGRGREREGGSERGGGGRAFANGFIESDWVLAYVRPYIFLLWVGVECGVGVYGYVSV